MPQFKLPTLGENIATADIVNLLVKEGESVNKDQAVLELETAKAVFELPIPFAGIIRKILVNKGDKVKVGQGLFEVDGSDEKTNENAEKLMPVKSEPFIPSPSIPLESKAATKEELREAAQKIESIKEENLAPLSESSAAPFPVYASPLTRRIAREKGINLEEIQVLKKGERISIEDLKQEKNIFKGEQNFPLPDFSLYGLLERKPFTALREKSVENLSHAWNVIPHVTQCDYADITHLEELKKRFSKRVEQNGAKLTLTAILMKVCAAALKVFPQINTSLDEAKKEIIYKKYVHLGIAVDTERGLLVPVLKDVDKKNIIEISLGLQEISKKAREKKLSPDQMQGGTFSISNLGNMGATTFFTPIVNWPEAAILGVGRSELQPVYEEGKWVPKNRLPLSLSYDHRLIDGADAARFLKWICDALHDPFLMDLEGRPA